HSRVPHERGGVPGRRCVHRGEGDSGTLVRQSVSLHRLSQHRAGREGTGGEASMTYVGERVARKEDHHLITGRGRYVGDIRLPRMVEAAILRSPIAHGRIKSLDTSRALELDGVVAVVTA